jgi:DtxR family Mn-dependent transcriptional regulator
MNFQSPARRFQFMAIRPESLALEGESPAMGLQFMAIGLESPAIGFQSPAVTIQLPGIETENIENRANMPCFIKFQEDMRGTMTQSLEDYLEMVSFLADEGAVRVTDIAAHLGVSKPSVLTALKTLEEWGLLEHKRYRTVSLTKKGAIQAAEIRKRHRLLTIFLQTILGVGKETAEKDACKMEHILSGETLEKIEKLLNCRRKKRSSGGLVSIAGN